MFLYLNLYTDLNKMYQEATLDEQPVKYFCQWLFEHAHVLFHSLIVNYEPEGFLIPCLLTTL